MEYVNEYIYLRTRPKEDGSVHRVGVLSLKTADHLFNSGSISIGISLCSPEDNFDSNYGVSFANGRNVKVLPDTETLKKVPFESILKAGGMEQVAKRQDLDMERSEVSYQRLRERFIDRLKGRVA